MPKTKIRVTIKRYLRAQGVKNAYQLQKILELSPTTAADLWRGDKLPRLESLEKICERWGCELGDLVRFVGTRRPKSRNGNGAS